MEEAVQAMQNLAQQCSDPTAVQDVVTHLFKILGGEIRGVFPLLSAASLGSRQIGSTLV